LHSSHVYLLKAHIQFVNFHLLLPVSFHQGNALLNQFLAAAVFAEALRNSSWLGHAADIAPLKIKHRFNDSRVPTYLFVINLLDKPALLRATLIAISHLLEVLLHVLLDDLPDSFDYQRVHLTEQLKFHIFLQLL